MNNNWKKSAWVAAGALWFSAACGGPSPAPGNGDGQQPGGGVVKVPVSVDGLTRGEVRSESGDFTCSSGLCILEGQAGTTVTLTAVPMDGAVFTGWSGDCSGTNTCRIEFQLSRKVRANFGLPGAWSRAIGSIHGDDARAVARDASGNVTIVGELGGASSLDGQTLAPGSFLSRFDSSGALQWHRSLPLITVPRAHLLSLEDGGLLLAGSFSNTIQIGTQSLTSAGGADIVLVRLDASGQPLWARRYGGTGRDVPRAIAVDPEGHIHLSGDSEDGLEFEGAAMPIYGPGFIAELTSSGDYIHGDTLAGINAFAFDAQGHIYVTGWRNQASDTLIVDCFDTNGTLLWSHSSTDPSAGRAEGMAVHVLANGTVLVAGQFSGYLADVKSGFSPSNDLFLMRFSPDGTLLGSKLLGGPSWDFVTGMGVDAEGNVLLAGHSMSESLDFGGGELMLHPGRGQQAFLARLTPEGAHLGSIAFGGDGTESLVSLAGGSGGTVAFGTFEQAVHFGDAERTSAGSKDLFLLSLP